MIITNKYNLPKALVDTIKNNQFAPTEKHYSVTTILSPTRSVLLTRRYFNEIEVDASRCINQLLGTATHSIIEKFDKTGFAEIYLKEEIFDGYYLTGKCDLYDEENFCLVDYKTATVWKIKFSDFEDWKKQGLMYAWLLRKKGKFVDKLKFYGLLKDWTAREKRLADLKGDFYPETQVYEWCYEISENDMIEIENFIKERFTELIENETISDNDLPDCGQIDTWYTGDKYAVYKSETAVKAARVLDSEQEAKDYIENKLNGIGIIRFRQGEYRKCQDYCDCCKYCKYYEERKPHKGDDE